MHSTIKPSMHHLNMNHASNAIWLWMIAVFLSYVIFFQTISTQPIYLNDYVGITANHFSRLIIINVVIVITLQFVTPLLEKYLTISAISAIGTILIGIGLVFVIVHSYTFVIASVIIWSIGEIFLLGVTPIYAKVFAGNSKEKNLQYSSNYYAACYLGKIIGPLGGSFLYSHFNWHDSLLGFLFFLSLLTGFCFYYLGKMMEQTNLVEVYDG
ncbi:MAG: hypothetical protein JO149_09950 [Gammaproteobacteria bacterium]|nr:hypothetical protein [Gammaproteobacteria bacterium]